ncbi:MULTISPECIES: MarR family transcriptional regulator [unclassified Sphingomonas]|uniref:MarR family winged helix-turn-helix transcriptional regulator n=1 Tax=unclassified Sphingomonas TaxID=196159 RepID=UPI001F58A2D4|nr:MULTISPECIES: MarR family transcriptional regulator [unclassified Sphingomonas]
MPFYESDGFTPETSVGYLTKRIQQLAAQRLEPVFAAAGTTYLQWSALVAIWWGREMTCAELARAIAHDSGATTRLLDVLEEKGWVERRRSLEDRRVVKLVLTQAGQAVAKECRATVAECWNGWLIDWEKEEAAMLLTLLQRLRTTLETTEAPCA